jgi:hypothetical protein
MSWAYRPREPTSVFRPAYPVAPLTGMAFKRCRVQFDRRELGVELVKDVDVMPIDPLDSLPPSLLSASGHLLLNGRRATNGVPQVPSCIRLAPRPH